MRLAMNEDLEEEEEGLEEEQEEEDARYKVPITWTINVILEHNLITLFFSQLTESYWIHLINLLNRK